jgi:hypothetical protein
MQANVTAADDLATLNQRLVTAAVRNWINRLATPTIRITMVGGRK